MVPTITPLSSCDDGVGHAQQLDLRATVPGWFSDNPTCTKPLSRQVQPVALA